MVGPDGMVNGNGADAVPIMPGTVAGKILQIEAAPVVNDANAGTPGKQPIVKRRRRGDDGADGEVDPITEAASHVDGRQTNENPVLELSWDWRPCDSL